VEWIKLIKFSIFFFKKFLWHWLWVFAEFVIIIYVNIYIYSLYYLVLPREPHKKKKKCSKDLKIKSSWILIWISRSISTFYLNAGVILSMFKSFKLILRHARICIAWSTTPPLGSLMKISLRKTYIVSLSRNLSRFLSGN
jgi:hypothetical protein